MPETEARDDLREKRELLAQLLKQGKEADEAARKPISRPVEAHRSSEAAQVSTIPPVAPSPASMAFAAAPAPVAVAPVQAAPMQAAPVQVAPHITQATPTRQRKAAAARDPFDTSVIDAATVDRVAINSIRTLAYVILVVSFFGSVLAFDGNWQPSMRFWQGISPYAAGAGIALQIEITLVEWWRGTHLTDPVYLFHLALDSVLTFIGYWPYLGQPLMHALGVIVVTLATWTPPDWALQLFARALFAVACVVVARMPERWLVRRRG